MRLLVRFGTLLWLAALLSACASAAAPTIPTVVPTVAPQPTAQPPTAAPQPTAAPPSSGDAPGRPFGLDVWTPGNKQAVGTAFTYDQPPGDANPSRVWFGITNGAITEGLYPDVSQANLKSLGVLVTDGKSFLADEMTDATTEVARIKAAESVLKDYFGQVFAERHSNFEELFTRLDNALQAGDGETVNLVVRGIVDIAKSSPLADLGDLAKIRAALDDPDQVWEF